MDTQKPPNADLLLLVSFIHYKCMDLIYNGYIKVRMDGSKGEDRLRNGWTKGKKAGESAGRKDKQKKE